MIIHETHSQAPTDQGSAIFLTTPSVPGDIADLSEQEWRKVEPVLEAYYARTSLQGRPSVSRRSVLNAVLWKILSGQKWQCLPRRFPSYQTCHRYFLQWYYSGLLRKMIVALYGAHGDQLYWRALHAAASSIHHQQSKIRIFTDGELRNSI